MAGAEIIQLPDSSLPQGCREPGPGHPLTRVFGRISTRGRRNHYLQALRRVLTTLEWPSWQPAWRTEPLPVSEADVYAYPWADLTPEDVDEALRSLHGTGTHNLAAVALRLTVQEYLRSLDDRIEEADDLLEELQRRARRAAAAESLRAERLHLRHQRRGLRLTRDTLEGRSRARANIPAGRALTTAELERLYRTAETDPDSIRGARQAALVTMLLCVRRFELARLDVANVDAATGRVLVRYGKGGKTAEAWIPEQGLPAVARWLAARGDAPGSLLGLSYEAIYRQLQNLAKRAGLSVVTPHDLRRTACTALLAAGVAPHLVQRQMRHSDFSTTQRYDHSQAEKVRRAVARLAVPCARE